METQNGLPKIQIRGIGSGAEGEAIVTGGVITGIKITKAGIGYTSGVTSVAFERHPEKNLRYTKISEPGLGKVGSIEHRDGKAGFADQLPVSCKA